MSEIDLESTLPVSKEKLDQQELDQRFYLNGRVGLTEDEVTWVMEHKSSVTNGEGEDKTPIENSVVAKLLATIAYLEKEK